MSAGRIMWRMRSTKTSHQEASPRIPRVGSLIPAAGQAQPAGDEEHNQGARATGAEREPAPQAALVGPGAAPHAQTTPTRTPKTIEKTVPSATIAMVFLSGGQSSR